MHTYVNLIHMLQEDHTKRVKEVMPPPHGMKQRTRWKYSLNQRGIFTEPQYD